MLRNRHFPLPLILACMALALCMACHNGRLSRDERRARKAAERSYAYLADGKAAKFVEGIAYSDSLPEGYRQEMADLISEHLHSLKLQHGDLSGIKAVGQAVEGDQGQVYLQLCFADSTCEEIGVPMVKVNGKWFMQ